MILAAVRNRRLGRADLVLMVVNTVVGAGIVALPGRAYALSGGYAFVALAVAAAAAMAIALTFARLAVRFHGAGGPYLYVTRTFGPGAGFGILALLVPTRLLATAVSLNILIEALGIVGAARPVAIAGVAVTMTALALTGIFLPIRLSNLMGALKIMLFAGLAVAGLSAFVAGVPTQLQPPATGPLHVGAAVLMWFYALSGFESPTILAAESRNPVRDLPVALVGGLATASLLYAGLLITCVAYTPALAMSSGPLLHLDGVFAPRFAPFLALAFASLVIATLPSQFAVAPRLLASAAADHGLRLLFPDHSGISAVAILLCSSLAVMLSVLDLTTLIISSGLVRLASYAACSLGLLRVAQKDGSNSPDQAVALAALIACVAVVGITVL